MILHQTRDSLWVPPNLRPMKRSGPLLEQAKFWVGCLGLATSCAAVNILPFRGIWWADDASRDTNPLKTLAYFEESSK